MDSKRLLKHLVLLMFFIFLANILALKFYWYSLLWYFDVIMHTLGGVWVGMFFLYVFKRKNFNPPDSILFFKVVLATIVVGLLWEFYEFYIYQYLIGNPFDLFDTTSDLVLDVLGSFLSFLYFSKFIMVGARNRLQSIQ